MKKQIRLLIDQFQLAEAQKLCNLLIEEENNLDAKIQLIGILLSRGQVKKALTVAIEIKAIEKRFEQECEFMINCFWFNTQLNFTIDQYLQQLEKLKTHSDEVLKARFESALAFFYSLNQNGKKAVEFFERSAITLKENYLEQYLLNLKEYIVEGTLQYSSKTDFNSLFKEGIKLCKQLKNPDFYLGNLYLTAPFLHMSGSDLVSNSSILLDFLKKAEKHLALGLKKDWPFVSNFIKLNFRFLHFYFEHKDFDEVIIYGERILNSSAEASKETYMRGMIFYFVIQAACNSKNFLVADQYMREHRSFVKNLNQQEFLQFSNHFYFLTEAIYNKTQGNIKESILFAQKCEEIFLSHGLTSTANEFIDLYVLLSNITTGKEKIHYAQKCYTVGKFDKIPSTNFNRFRASCEIFLGHAFFENAEYDKAEQKFYEGLHFTLLSNDINNYLLYDGEFIFEQKALSAIVELANINFLKFHQNESIKNGTTALQWSIKSFTLVERIQRKMNGEISKILYREKLIPLVTQTLKYLIGTSSNLDLAFKFIERIKANSLKAGLSEQKAKSLLGEKKLEKEETLKKRYLNLESKSKRSKASEDFNQFFEAKNEYVEFIRQIEKENIEYYRLKYQLTSIDLPTIQTQLSDQQYILNYFYYKRQLFIQFTSSDEVELVEVVLPENFEQMISSFVQSIKKQNIKEYISLAFELYKFLIYPVADLLDDIFSEDKSVKELIILPFASLFQLPFEALISKLNNEPKYQNLHYLINEFDISYHYSGTLWGQNIKLSAGYTKEFIAFAPIYDTVKENKFKFDVLEASEKEVSEIGKLFSKNQIYKREEAALIKVLSVDLNSRFVHFAAHFHHHDVNKLSGIVLHNGEILNLNALINLTLTAEMVTLGACESAVGNLYQSEGMIAMNRAFMALGVRYVMSTLFKINDLLSSNLMIEFYKNILAGQKHSNALANAKRSIITREDVNVFHWSAFVLFGK